MNQQAGAACCAALRSADRLAVPRHHACNPFIQTVWLLLFTAQPFARLLNLPRAICSRDSQLRLNLYGRLVTTASSATQTNAAIGLRL